jgi:DNA-binding CsgD family transcriptional regulator
MLGRGAERERIDQLLARARTGGGGALVVRGEPGIGKTTLLEYARERASAMRTLSAVGVEVEAGIPFGGLFELLRPVIPLLERIPPPQAAALRAGLGLDAGGSSDRFLIGAATLSLLAAAAEDGPLAVLVDDFQWLDRPSAEALVFAARRLIADPIAVIATVREGERSALDTARIPEHILHGLDRANVSELLRRLVGSDVSADAVDRMVAVTGGNPLALVELSGRLDELSGELGSGPVPISERVGGVFLRRLRPLSDGARTAILVAAASDAGALDEVYGACQTLGIDPRASLEEAEASGLATVTPTGVEFRHPLARSTCYSAASPAERRAAHRALAPRAEPDRRAWHLAQSAIGPDEEAAAALAAAARRASERHAYSVAAAAAERAAALTGVVDLRVTRLLAAAEAAFLAGDTDRALASINRAAESDVDADVHGAVEELRGRITLRRGPISEGLEILLPAAAKAAGRDAGRAIEMLAECVAACAYSGDTVRILELAELAHTIVVDDDDVRSRAIRHVLEGAALIYAGHGGAEGPDQIRAALALLEVSADLRSDIAVLEWMVFGVLFLREGVVGAEVCEAVLDAIRETGAVGRLPRVLAFTARDAATRDRWSAAAALYHEAIAAAEETGQDTERAWTLGALAALQARQGLEQEARASAAEAIGLSKQLGASGNVYWAQAVFAELDLSGGDLAAAITKMHELENSLRAGSNADPDLSMVPELVEAYVHSGRTSDAAPVLADHRRAVHAKAQPWALARYHRACGLVAEDDAFDEAFREALQQHVRAPDAFEEARTRLCYGQRLRRARRRVDARSELRRAFAIFDRLGAARWRDIAAAELAATGETARRRDVSTLDDLTPQELSIATLLAGGRTTREAAATLFVSPKTIEYHLRHVYQKLGVRSREELTAALRPAPDPQAAGDSPGAGLMAEPRARG